MIRFIDEHGSFRGGVPLPHPACRSSWVHHAAHEGIGSEAGTISSISVTRILVPEIKRIHKKNYSVYGARKMQAKLQREGWQIGRDQTARIMKLAGVRGVRRSKKVYATKSDPTHALPGDKVERRFYSSGPKQPSCAM